MASLARLTNVVQQALTSGQYAGAIWLEGSPFVEETSYWLNLLIDTPVPSWAMPLNAPTGRSATTATAISLTRSTISCRASGRITTVETVSASWSFRMNSSSRRVRYKRLMPALGAMWPRAAMAALSEPWATRPAGPDIPAR